MKIEITSLRVVDCGPLKDVRIDFTDKETGKPLPVVLLAGANGSGKTTVLEVMYGLAQMLNLDLKQVPPILLRSSYAIMNCMIDGTPFSFHYGEIEKTFSDVFHEENIGNSKFLDSPPHPLRFKTRSLITKNTPLADAVRKAMSVSGFFLSTEEYEPGKKQDNPVFDPAPAFLFFPYYRAIEPAEGREVRRETLRYQWTYKFEVVKSYAGSLSSYLIWLDYAEPNSFRSVNEFLNSLYPDKKTFGINRRALKPIVYTANGGMHDMDKLSSGEQNLLIVLLELRRRLLPGSIVLIDELENSLHPAFQHRLAQGLLQLQREIPFQLIATTHAETFVDIFGTKATRILPVPSAVPAAEIK